MFHIFIGFMAAMVLVFYSVFIFDLGKRQQRSETKAIRDATLKALETKEKPE